MHKQLTPEQTAYLEQLTLEWSDALTKYANRFTGYQEHLRWDVEDAVQLTLLKAVKDVDVLMNHENPAGWLKKSLHYTLLNMRRSMNNKPVIPVAEIRDDDGVMFSAAPDPFGMSDSEPGLPEVLALANRVLTSAELETFRDYFLYDYTMEQTARIEHQTAATIRGRISRIRQKLKRHIG